VGAQFRWESTSTVAIKYCSRGHRYTGGGGYGRRR
jgi:hypothetical protein